MNNLNPKCPFRFWSLLKIKVLQHLTVLAVVDSHRKGADRQCIRIVFRETPRNVLK